MYPRSSHTKSRNGCGQCKRRHIKCNLQAPICSNCKKRDQLCDYQSLHMGNPPRRGDGEERAHRAGAAFTSQPFIQYFVLGQPQIPRLLDISPAVLLSLHDGECRVVSDEFAHAMAIGRQPFLEHCLLALASLYPRIWSPAPTPEMCVTAYTHHIEASRLFRRSVKTITEHNWVAALGFAVSVVIFHFNAVPQHASGENNFMETISTLRSTALLGNAIAPWFQRSRIKILVESHVHPEDVGSVCSVGAILQSVLAFEAALGQKQLSTESERGTYLAAIEALRQWILTAHGQPRAWIDFIWWPAAVRPDYLALLSHREPGAVTIFLHWCAVMMNAPRRWFLEGWATRMASSAMKEMGPEWDLLLQYPKAVLGLGQPYNGGG